MMRMRALYWKQLIARIWCGPSMRGWCLISIQMKKQEHVPWKNIVLFEDRSLAKEAHFPCNDSELCIHLYETVQETNLSLNSLGFLVAHNISTNIFCHLLQLIVLIFTELQDSPVQTIS